MNLRTVNSDKWLYNEETMSYIKMVSFSLERFEYYLIKVDLRYDNIYFIYKGLKGALSDYYYNFTKVDDNVITKELNDSLAKGLLGV